MKKRAAKGSIRKDKTEVKEEKEIQHVTPENAEGFPDDIDFKKFLGCGG